MTCLVADIGGTNVRLAAFSGSPLEATKGLLGGSLETQAVYEWDDLESLSAGIDQFCEQFALKKPFAQIAVAFAGLTLPDQEVFALTNRDQVFIRAQLLEVADQVHVINDFAAQASLIPHLDADQLITLKSGEQRSGARAVLGPGTGLGVAGLTTTGQVMSGEGGHVALPHLPHAPHAALAELLGQPINRLEDVLCGTGLENLNAALGHAPASARALSEAALKGSPEAQAVFNLFFDFLAIASANQALQYAAAGGVYLVGNITLANLDLINRARLAELFEGTVSHAEFLKQVPIYVVRTAMSGLAGAAAYLAAC